MAKSMYDIIKKQNGERFAKAIRNYDNGIFDVPNIDKIVKYAGRGAVGMARALDVNSADSQFFICFDDCAFLDSKYTLWGRVVSGMDVVDKIKRGDEMDNGHVENPDKIIKMEVVD